MRRTDVAEDVLPATARLIEAGFGLLRAEASLAAVRARELLVGAVAALVATVVAGAFAQLVVVLAVLSPLLVELVSLEHLLMSLGASAVLALAAGTAAYVAWRRVARLPVGSSESAGVWGGARPPSKFVRTR